MPLPMRANGDIPPSRFVKLDTTDNHVVVCGAGEDAFGISQKATRRANYSTLDDGLAAKAGEDLTIFQIGETCLLEMGGSVVPGLIKSGALGVGVQASADHDKVGAKTSQTGVSGQLLEVQVQRFDVSA